MKVIKNTLPRDWNLFLIGDSHEGLTLRSKRAWDHFGDLLESEYGGLKASRNRWIDHGDMAEWRCIDHPFYYEGTSTSGMAGIVEKQIQECVRQRKPFKRKCLGILQGNHEFGLWKYANVAEVVCRELNVPYGTYEAVFVYNDNGGFLQFRHFATHGFKTITSNAKDPDQRLGNKLARLKVILEEKMSNVLLMSMGHTHQLLINPPKPRLTFEENGGGIERGYTSPKRTDGYIHPDYRWYVNTGSFLDYYVDGDSGYMSRKGYDPTDIGFAVVRIRNGLIDGIDPIRVV